ncbi:unnamed protein product [Coregonus sp. 'balchen']|nr:unnamed protein product [Coregonus sp. 'balchen']
MNTASITIILLTLLAIFSTTEGIKQPLVLRCLCPKVQAGLIPFRDLKSCQTQKWTSTLPGPKEPFGEDSGGEINQKNAGT